MGAVHQFLEKIYGLRLEALILASSQCQNSPVHVRAHTQRKPIEPHHLQKQGYSSGVLIPELIPLLNLSCPGFLKPIFASVTVEAAVLIALQYQLVTSLPGSWASLTALFNGVYQLLPQQAPITFWPQFLAATREALNMPCSKPLASPATWSN